MQEKKFHLFKKLASLFFFSLSAPYTCNTKKKRINLKQKKGEISKKRKIPPKPLTKGIKARYYFDTRQVCVKALVVCRRPGRQINPPRIIWSPHYCFRYIPQYRVKF